MQKEPHSLNEHESCTSLTLDPTLDESAAEQRDPVVICGDALTELRKLPERSVQCCVTSPPYWGLRDYGTARWLGGLPNCDHVYNHGTQGRSGQRADRTFTAQAVYKDECRKCGAIRVDRQLGLERTPEEYVGRIVEIFSEVRRVLRDDGTLWLNIGDSYATGGGKVGDCPGGGEQGARYRGDHARDPKNVAIGPQTQPNRMPIPGLKPKDLVGIPWRVAFALQADGWYLRSEIIWHKPNPMPESVTDRPTKAHEQIFLLAKSERYFYDTEAIMEPATGSAHDRARKGGAYDGQKTLPTDERNGMRSPGVNPKARIPSGWDTGPGDHRSLLGRYRPKQNPSFSAAVTRTVDDRNKRSVWTVPTAPYPEAHFATFPPALIEPCIKAGCLAGGTVLDPFAGSGTTLEVARRMGCNSIGIELSPEYCKLIEKRLRQDVLALVPIQRESGAASATATAQARSIQKELSLYG